LLVKEGSRFVANNADEINLLNGVVYVDLDPAQAHGRLSVRTDIAYWLPRAVNVGITWRFH
jgi:hypothetical protein